jgi:hypothetical protein
VGTSATASFHTPAASASPPRSYVHSLNSSSASARSAARSANRARFAFTPPRGLGQNPTHVHAQSEPTHCLTERSRSADDLSSSLLPPPVPGQQLSDAAAGVICDVAEDVSEISVGLDAIELGGLDDGVERGCALRRWNLSMPGTSAPGPCRRWRPMRLRSLDQLRRGLVTPASNSWSERKRVRFNYFLGAIGLVKEHAWDKSAAEVRREVPVPAPGRNRRRSVRVAAPATRAATRRARASRKTFRTRALKPRRSRGRVHAAAHGA